MGAHMRPSARLDRAAGVHVMAGFAALIALISVASSASQSEAAENNWMSEDEMRATFTGATVEGKYGSGRPFSEVYEKHGGLQYREEDYAVGGKWSVQAGTFCTIYDNDPSGGCFRVKKVSGNCYEFYFVAPTENEAHSAPKRPSWPARGSIVGKPGICADQHSV